MRWILVVALLLLPLWGQAEVVGPTVNRHLCHAAGVQGGLRPLINRLLRHDRLAFSDAAAVLEMDCGNRTLMEILLNERQAENLEYVVIDMGLSVHQTLTTAAGTMSLLQWLEYQSQRNGDPQVRAFARTYHKRLQDVSFNPNLLVLAQ